MGTTEASTTELLGGLLTDAKDLATAHAAQLKLEVRSELASLKDIIKLTGVAIAAVVLAGLLLTQALVLGLSAATGLPLWASFAIVGVVVAAIGYAVYHRRPPAVDLVPSEALASVKRDVEHIAAAAKT